MLVVIEVYGENTLCGIRITVCKLNSENSFFLIATFALSVPNKKRLLASKNKEQVKEEIFSLEPSKQPSDFIRDPYVLEFLGIQPSADLYEKKLEQALIDNFQFLHNQSRSVFA